MKIKFLNSKKKDGPRATLSGFIIFTILCGAGQICYTSIYNYRQRLIIKSQSLSQNVSNDNIRDTNIQNEKKKIGFLDRLATIKWSPVTKLSEEQYQELMKAREKKRLEKEGNTDKTENN